MLYVLELFNDKLVSGPFERMCSMSILTHQERINLTLPLHFVTPASVRSPSKCPGLALEAIPKVLYIYIDTATGSWFHCLHRTTYIRVRKKTRKTHKTKLKGKKFTKQTVLQVESR